MHTKPIYLHRLFDGAFFIYKLCDFDKPSIELIHIGKAYNKDGLFSTQFKKYVKKYSLNRYAINDHLTSSSYNEFICRVYLASDKVGTVLNKIPVPPFIMDNRIEPIYINNLKRLELEKKINLNKIKIELNKANVDPKTIEILNSVLEKLNILK